MLSLLPKNGDLALPKNWRPAAFSVQILINRLMNILEILVNTDQTYCVSDRTIWDWLTVQGCTPHGENGGRNESDPFSGQLYGLAFESLLCGFKDWLSSFSLSVDFSVDQDPFTHQPRRCPSVLG